MTEREYKKYEKMVMKLAHSFQKTSQLECDDLMAEAHVAYAEALNTYNDRLSSLQTWIYLQVRNRLCTHLLKSKKTPSLGGGWDEENTRESKEACPEKKAEFHQLLSTLSKESLFICRIIFSSPGLYANLPPTIARRRLMSVLRHNGWKKVKVQECFSEIKTTLTEA